MVSGLDELEKDKSVLSQRLLYLMTQEGETWSREGAKASADTGEIAALQKRIESVVRTDKPSSPGFPPAVVVVWPVLCLREPLRAGAVAAGDAEPLSGRGVRISRGESALKPSPSWPTCTAHSEQERVRG